MASHGQKLRGFKPDIRSLALDDIDISILMSYRVTTPDRLEMLAAVIQTLTRSIGGTRIPIRIIDSSPPDMRTRVEREWQTSGLDVEIQASDVSQCEAFWSLINTCPTRWFYLQFDDMITVGLDAHFLAGACQLLDAYAGMVDVVCPFWPVESVFDEHQHKIRLVSHVETDRHQPRYRFAAGRSRPALATHVLSSRKFGVFRNFTYGFFFNNLVAPTDDFRRRFAWYREHVSGTSVHRIEEVAAGKVTGPFWPHVGVCLDGISIFDLDFAHTSAAVRREVPENRRNLEAIRTGWDIRAASASK